MIVVTGATGQLGHMIVKQLLKRLPASQIGASVRDPAKAQDLKSLGVRIRAGNFDDLKSLSHSFEGADQILLVSSNASATGGDPVAQHRSAIAAARAAAVKRVVYTSHMGANPTSDFPPMRDHAATEDMLQASGLEWTALRNGFYASSGIMLMGDGLKSGTFDAPADGKVSWTAHADLAEAAAITLSQPIGEDGPTPALTASHSFDLSDMAAIAAELMGKPVLRNIVSDAYFSKMMVSRGVPSRALDIVIGLYRASQNGEFKLVDPALKQILNRDPMTLREALAQKIDDLHNV